MSDRQKTVIRILLLVAKILAEPDLKREIESLASHISVRVTE